jgi:hypothetical protein
MTQTGPERLKIAASQNGPLLAACSLGFFFQLLVLFRSYGGVSLDEGDQIPDLVIIVDFTVRRHCTHLDAVFDDPEQVGARQTAKI